MKGGFPFALQPRAMHIEEAIYGIRLVPVDVEDALGWFRGAAQVGRCSRRGGTCGSTVQMEL